MSTLQRNVTGMAGTAVSNGRESRNAHAHAYVDRAQPRRLGAERVRTSRAWIGGSRRRHGRDGDAAREDPRGG